MAGIAQTLIDLILVPGSSLRLVPVINVSLALLVLFIIVAGMYLDIGTIHVVVLASLAFGLFLSVNWSAYCLLPVRLDFCFLHFALL